LVAFFGVSAAQQRCSAEALGELVVLYPAVLAK
jgi:hypothetical protein